MKTNLNTFTTIWNGEEWIYIYVDDFKNEFVPLKEYRKELEIKRHKETENKFDNLFEKGIDEFAIGFAVWVNKLEEKLPYLGVYEFQQQFGRKTFKELLEIYKKEKGL